MKPWTKEQFKNTHIVVTPEQSEKLQNYLYKLGVTWSNHGKPESLNYKHLFVTEDYNIEFSKNLDFDFCEKTILYDDIIFPNSQIEIISEQLSVSDYAKYQVGEINDNYVNEIMSTHYNNLDNIVDDYINIMEGKYCKPNYPSKGSNIGYKESEGKLNVEYDWEFLEAQMKRIGANKHKYKPYNWHNPIDIESLKSALFRHTLEVMKNNYNDGEEELGHILAISINAMMIYYQLKNNK